MSIRLDSEEKFVSFQYAKITCGREINGGTGLSQYLQGLELSEILNRPFAQINDGIKPADEETQFILYLEWDALRSSIAQYLGSNAAEFDKNRCRITSIDYDETGIEIAQVILPPKELPKILPCSLAKF